MVSTHRRAATSASRSSLARVARVVVLLLGSGAQPAILTAQSNSAVAWTIRTYSTISSIGIEWDLVGDADHDATAAVEFRVAGTAGWRPALPLVRVDYNGSNMFAGSVLFLNPNTAYEVRLTLDRSRRRRRLQTVVVATRPVPVMPVVRQELSCRSRVGRWERDPRQIHSEASRPLRRSRSLETSSSYTPETTADASRLPNRARRAGTSCGRQLATARHCSPASTSSASYVWLEGLTLRDQPFALMSKNAPTGVVISRCSFFNNHYSIYLQRGGSYWYIADNTIVGDTPYSTESLDGEGIELNGYSVESFGHVVAHNSISNVADGISNGTYNIDVFGNDIFDTSDDGFEGDPGGANIRVWGNRIHNAAHNGISYQPQNGSPWYIIRNQLVGFMEAPFKFRTTDRSVIAHNTIVMWSKMICCNDAHLLRSIVKNNLWVSVVRRADLGFRVDREGLAERFQQRRLRLGIKHGAVPVRRRGLLEPRRLSRRRPASRRTDDRSIGRPVSRRSMCQVRRRCRFRRST